MRPSRFLRRAAGPALLLACFLCPAAGQQPAPSPVPVVVDTAGVMRWGASGEEVALFGVNYTTPFAYAYRALGRVGADRRAAIDADVAHLARLGLDAFRVHVWDREVSDRAGNLVANDHLDLLDYLIARLTAHGIRTVLTPISWWDTGYPEPQQPTAGFSDDYDKGALTVDPEARRIQERYVAQFVAHVNPYTGLSYSDDPAVLAIELFNEPSHPGTPEETTAFVDALARAAREAGWGKPIFYNVSQGYYDAHGHAVCAAGVQGVTAQWYPTGLVRGGTLGGNLLPNVDRYPIPFDAFPECRDKARMVYEFDAADAGGSYLYPAMARSFRGAGFQWATQFAYDPLPIAYSNTEYQTHFLNLVYTPGKAVSFMIAAEAFRRLPRGFDVGVYPASARFGPFRVSYEEDLSEMAMDTAFFYSNSTTTAPPDPAALHRVAGVGASPVVAYEGTGAYFLDRLEGGVWRLEVYPDAVWVDDPFERPSLRRRPVRLLWRTWPMRVALPGLGPAFSVEPVDEGNAHRPAVNDGAFAVRPGVYLLARAPAVPDAWKEAARSRPFVAPPATGGPAEVLHTPPSEAVAGRLFTVFASIVADSPADSVALFVRRLGGGPARSLRLPMAPAGGYRHAATVPAEVMRAGLVEYGVTVYEGGQARTFPGGDEGHPFQWDFTGGPFWRVAVVEAQAPVVLFDARRDLDRLLLPGPWNGLRASSDYVAGSEGGRLAVQVRVTDLARPPHRTAARAFLARADRARMAVAGPYPEGAGVLRVRARAAGRPSERVQVALVTTDGAAWGATVALTDEWQEVEVPVASLARVPLALLPDAYPGFMPDRFEAAVNAAAPDLRALDGVQLVLDAALLGEGERAGAHGFEVERILLDLPSSISTSAR